MHNMDRSQIVVAYNARQSGSQVELSRISVSLEFECFLKNDCDNGNKILTIIFIETSLDFWVLSHFAFFDETSVIRERWEEKCLQGKFFDVLFQKNFVSGELVVYSRLESTR